ncbi:hypothetical protein CES85_2450 [Ochrobactrum quorumnocens]|uniref:Uncharacterized protein n=1 Tax=Ochrobactrum quorumnocens TaxID=271865 RepID=A0A248UHE3_9HYPH|nr:hypothetical protein CES85_2450 [[Ochrobactrum] quorumnocens]
MVMPVQRISLRRIDQVKETGSFSKKAAAPIYQEAEHFP